MLFSCIIGLVFCSSQTQIYSNILNITYKHTPNSSSRQCTFRNISHPKVNNCTTLGPSTTSVPQVRSVRPIVRKFTCYNARRARRMFMTFDIWQFYEKLLSQANFHLVRTILTTALHEGLHAFLRVSRASFAKYLSKRKLLRTKVAEKNQTHILGSVHSPHKTCSSPYD
jgi:hypothetical protein